MKERAARTDLILASASPRRRELLSRLGLSFRVVPPQVEEGLPATGDPEEIAIENARKKTLDVAARVGKGLVIGADTLVASPDGIIGKPRDAEEAKQILRRLSGTRHAVITGLCLMDAETGRTSAAADRTWVTMRRMSEEEIADYVASEEPLGKAGAYAIQEQGDRYVERLEGSFSNVVGMPLELLARMLEDFGVKVGVGGPSCDGFT